MSDEKLPPGQYELDDFPRFGLSKFANRFPKETHQVYLKITGDIDESVTVSDELRHLPRVDQTSDFHCVTTWTRRSLRWSGFRFSDFYERIVIPRARPRRNSLFVFLRCQDGYASSLPLADLLADTVLLADRLNGEPLSIEHGAPLRLVAPAHYGLRTPSTYALLSSGVMIANIDDRRHFDSWTIRGLGLPWRSVAEEFRVGFFVICIAH